jgi:hypothetical protein
VVRAVRWGALLMCVGFSGHVLAGDTPTERARDLQRDQALVQMLIDSGLKLAAEKDPLRRADQCNRLADKFAKEIKVAVQQKDTQRAALFGEQVQALLTKGVAANLTCARALPEPDPSREPEILRLGVEASVTTKSVEDELASHPELESENMHLTLQAVARGKAEVDKAVQGKKNKR